MLLIGKIIFTIKTNIMALSRNVHPKPQMYRCYYFDDNNFVGYFETTCDKIKAWNRLCVRLFNKGIKPSKEHIAKYVQNGLK